MRKNKIRLAGLIAFLLGMPLTEKAFGGWEDVVGSSIDLGWSIARIARGS